MIRWGKPVQLLEWGEGTNTLNQRWEKVGEGMLVNQSKPFWQTFLDWLLLKRESPRVGLTTLVVELTGPLNRKNEKEDAIKVVQQGEGMTPGSNRWGEVAVGRLKSVESKDGKTKVSLEIKGATKIGR
jgi:hypothetical protein